MLENLRIDKQWIAQYSRLAPILEALFAYDFMSSPTVKQPSDTEQVQDQEVEYAMKVFQDLMKASPTNATDSLKDCKCKYFERYLE